MDIQLLVEEQKTYAATWDSRKTVFDGIVERLVIMSDTVRDEKAEQERRRQLDDADDVPEEGAVLPPAAGSGSTPVHPTLDPNLNLIALEGQELDPKAKPFEPSSGIVVGGGTGMDVDRAEGEGEGEREGEGEGQGDGDEMMEGVEVEVKEVGELEEGQEREEKEEGEA